MSFGYETAFFAFGRADPLRRNSLFDPAATSSSFMVDRGDHDAAAAQERLSAGLFAIESPGYGRAMTHIPPLQGKFGSARFHMGDCEHSWVLSLAGPRS
jgi:hypothetical protein